MSNLYHGNIIIMKYQCAVYLVTTLIRPEVLSEIAVYVMATSIRLEGLLK